MVKYYICDGPKDHLCGDCVGKGPYTEWSSNGDKNPHGAIWDGERFCGKRRENTRCIEYKKYNFEIDKELFEI